MITKKITLAVIDDHNLLRTQFCDLLDKLGYEVIIQAENGEDALKKFENSKQLPKVCLLDVSMPVMDGFETATALSKKYPGLRILACSLNNDEDSVIGMIKSGARGYMVKTGTIVETKQAIDTISDSGYYFDRHAVKILLEYLRKDVSPQKSHG